MFKQLQKLRRAFHVPSQQERANNYLNQATDRIDLEYRMRQVDRGVFL
ncbi:DUF3563 family protein [Roseibium limicola]|uniref:DUF3563 family protein n=1 Tax=Roseibium limicola TaxID=2816037 RepID=A0A939EQV2_9HYPH|nr:DUF3563 family protein [Roseibium limicola]MBO0346665.1 DUF3563 family protein [Roseibium limicola]